ncbi:Hypothetical protein D9617_19g101960 [Elsinoe fawcettii]|nr:Hypothetical protein D9617_19g101960 [Elsinoe fawcettii]
MGAYFTSEQTATTTYICSVFASLILITRLVASRQQPRPFDFSFVISSTLLLLVIVRAIITSQVLLHGTPSAVLRHAQLDPSTPLTPSQISHARLGAILSLVLRVLLPSILWLTNLLLLQFYTRFVSHLPLANLAVKFAYGFMLITYILTLLATFLECRPLRLHWQINPDPGSCVDNYLQITFQCIFSAMNDLLLVAIAAPIIKVHTEKKRHTVKLAVMVGLGLLCVIFAGLRLAYCLLSPDYQEVATFWASINVLVAVGIANAPVLYGVVRLMRKKRRGPVRAEVMVHQGLERQVSRKKSGSSTGWDVETGITKKTTVTVDREVDVDVDADGFELMSIPPTTIRSTLGDSDDG